MPRKSPSPADRTARRAAQRIGAECLAVRVRLLNRTLTGFYDDALRPLGLTAGQLNVLVVVELRGPISPGDVARRLNMEKSTVSRTVERMRVNGWLEVTPATSGRRLEVTLTRTGRDLLRRSLPAWAQAQEQAEALLGQRGADSLHRVGQAVWGQVDPE